MQDRDSIPIRHFYNFNNKETCSYIQIQKIILYLTGKMYKSANKPLSN